MGLVCAGLFAMNLLLVMLAIGPALVRTTRMMLVDKNLLIERQNLYDDDAFMGVYTDTILKVCYECACCKQGWVGGGGKNKQQEEQNLQTKSNRQTIIISEMIRSKSIET